MDRRPRAALVLDGDAQRGQTCGAWGGSALFLELHLGFDLGATGPGVTCWDPRDPEGSGGGRAVETHLRNGLAHLQPEVKHEVPRDPEGRAVMLLDKLVDERAARRAPTFHQNGGHGCLRFVREAEHGNDVGPPAQRLQNAVLFFNRLAWEAE